MGEVFAKTPFYAQHKIYNPEKVPNKATLPDRNVTLPSSHHSLLCPWLHAHGHSSASSRSEG